MHFALFGWPDHSRLAIEPQFMFEGGEQALHHCVISAASFGRHAADGPCGSGASRVGSDGAHSPADHTPAVQIDPDRQVTPTRTRADVGDVIGPATVGCKERKVIRSSEAWTQAWRRVPSTEKCSSLSSGLISGAPISFSQAYDLYGFVKLANVFVDWQIEALEDSFNKFYEKKTGVNPDHSGERLPALGQILEDPDVCSVVGKIIASNPWLMTSLRAVAGENCQYLGSDVLLVYDDSIKNECRRRCSCIIREHQRSNERILKIFERIVHRYATERFQVSFIVLHRRYIEPSRFSA